MKRQSCSSAETGLNIGTKTLLYGMFNNISCKIIVVGILEEKSKNNECYLTTLKGYIYAHVTKKKGTTKVNRLCLVW